MITVIKIVGFILIIGAMSQLMDIKNNSIT
nr:MAG TPA: hypothetical protein [Caudoviricetes sp.]